MKLAFATFLLVCLVLSSSFFEATMAGSIQDRCLKYCGICCEKCHCVPSGTYGNKDECPCYRDLKNSKGKSKCP
ncbi:gibberellin-regulated protein 10 [Quercus suber]|uniref:Gibberellin-regulated protein 10 n=1 Tax=Quercus suber TaxID=58331 RepID=A0AAW0KUZ1_QUESU